MAAPGTNKQAGKGRELLGILNCCQKFRSLESADDIVIFNEVRWCSGSSLGKPLVAAAAELGSCPAVGLEGIEMCFWHSFHWASGRELRPEEAPVLCSSALLCPRWLRLAVVMHCGAGLAGARAED